MSYIEVLNFWFDQLKPKQWFVKDPILDLEIKRRFGEAHLSATRCELFDWRKSPDGRLAEIIVLDQFSRNIYRDEAGAFAADSLALALAQEAIRSRADLEVPVSRRGFIYMPFMHSESPLIHRLAVQVFATSGLEGNLEFELKHKAIIDRFGRYPHRNQALGRHSTPEEIEFLKLPGSGF